MSDTADSAAELSRLTSRAEQIIRERTEAVAQALGQLADARGEPAKLRLLTMPPSPAADYRVFRATGTGVHLVFRNVEALPGFECVLGPKHAGGSAVTFAEALARANQGFTQLMTQLKQACAPAEQGTADLEEAAANVMEAARPGKHS